MKHGLLTTLPNGRVLVKDGQVMFEHTPGTPLYPRPYSVNVGRNRHERRALAAKLRAAKRRAAR